MAIINGTTGNDKLAGTAGNDEIFGLEGNDTIEGLDGNDLLDGGAGNDTIVDGAGSDTVYGREGDDDIVASPGTGSDVYDGGTGAATDIDFVLYTNALAGVVVDLGLASDQARSSGSSDAAGIGVDQLRNIEGVSGSDFADTLSGNGANNALIGRDGGDSLKGGGGDDLLNGGNGDDQLDGGLGTDRASYASAGGGVRVSLAITAAQDTGQGADTLVGIEDLTGSRFGDTLTGADTANSLSGGDGDDRLYGMGGDDQLNPGLGIDRMYGGDGNDTFYVRDVTDYTYENANEGTDLVFASVNYTLRANFEDLTLSGNSDLTGRGNVLANVITGSGGNNRLYGLDGDDTLYGGKGDDTLDGGVGLDRLFGGEGNDTYLINDSSDFTFERADEGFDRVYASLSYALRAHVEDLSLTGTADINGTGNDLSNKIVGNVGGNRLYGLDGDDRLYGLDGDDRLLGGLGNDRLDGGLGVDRMYGGTGNDTYIVTDRTDYAYEKVGEGTDLVLASLTHRLRANVENLELTGSASINGIGNDLGNVLTGNEGSNRLYGMAGDDRLLGGLGNDRLDGGAGIDRLYGGFGDDRYIVSDATDYAYENVAAGTDRVYASISHTLRANVEYLFLTGTGAIDAMGNDLANLIVGNDAANGLFGRDGNDKLFGRAGDDLLDGGTGNDWLEGGSGSDRTTGGGGADSFVFRAGDFGSAVPSGADQILDFSQSDGDRIRLDLVDADVLTAGDQAFTFVGTAAFSNVAGELRYEQDGTNTYLSGDTDGDGVADFTIRLDGLHAVGSNDLIL